jgi:hypothetical protein
MREEERMDNTLPWAGMLKIAGVRVEEVANATHLTKAYVYKQLNGTMPMTYLVRQACDGLIRARMDDWYPAVGSLIRLLAPDNTGHQVREIFGEENRRGRARH